MSARRIFQNFGFLTTGKLLGDAFTFLFFVVLSRSFGQEGIGQYSFAMALAGFFVVFSDFGLYTFSIKELSRRTGSLGDYYGRILSLRLLLSLASFVTFLLVLAFLPFSREYKVIIAVIGLYQVMYSLVNGFAAVFIAREDMHLAGLTEASLRAAAALIGITVVMAGGSLVMALAPLPAVGATQLFLAYWLVTRKYGRPILIASWSSLRQTMRDAVPYALSLFCYQLYSRTDVVLLGFLLGAAAAGVYNVAYRVIFLLLFIPHFASVSLLPLASRLYTSSGKELEVLYHRSLRLIILIGLPIASGVWLIAPDLIVLIFGEAFAESASVLRILAGMLFLSFINRTLSVFLMACDRQLESTKSHWTAAWANVVGNLLLIPAFGIKGAAVATLISEAVLVALFAVRLRAVLGWPRIGSRLVMGGVATASFCLPFAFFPSLSLGLMIPASMLVYMGILVLFKEIRRDEVFTLLSMVNHESVRSTSTGQ